MFLCPLQIIRLERVPIRTINLCTISVFLFTAIISLTSQGTATFFSEQANDNAVSSSLAVLKASLILQLFLNVVAVAVLASIYRPGAAKGVQPPGEARRVRIVGISLSIALTMILVRNLFRTVQSFLPPDSPAWTVEAYFWVFDATPMLAYTAVFHALHPAKYFPTQCDGSTATTSIERVGDAEMRGDSIELQSKI
jgi:heme/copper-type cytochrome/quinol oxidase subunit 2